MVKKVFNEVISYAKCIKRRLIASWEAHLPSRDTLLTSLWKSGEKDFESKKQMLAAHGITKLSQLIECAHSVHTRGFALA